jgi:hypothetical protein
MLIQEAQFRVCGECDTRKRISDDVYGCDECRAVIDSTSRQYLDPVVHRHDATPERLQFCSWACCMKGLRKVKTDYFVSLPMLLFDEKTPGLRPQDFFAELKTT